MIILFLKSISKLKQRYFIKLSYKGTHFHGWQSQPNSITIQETIEKAINTILQEKIELTGAGRTDTGVHAKNYIAHFDSLSNQLHGDEKFIHKLNCILPFDISIHQIFKVKQDAHARFDAISRTYHYYISHQKNPFFYDFSYYLRDQLNLDKMNEACKVLFEYSDFTSFCKLHSDVKTNNCKLINCKWEYQDNLLTFVIQSDRFLRNMVRAITGTMLDIGRNTLSLADLRTIIESKNRCNAGFSVPAHGLHLINIEYPNDILP